MHARQFVWVIVASALLSHSTLAADWSTYRAGAARTGFLEGRAPQKLVSGWTHHSPHPPQPAWPRSDRMPFDRAFQPIIAEGRVYFGSSVDGGLRCLDVASGETCWTFHTEAPIRFAPVYWRDRVIVASDDGHVYALAGHDGKLLWKKRGGPDHRFILGNERLISKWPSRGGPAVVGDVVYFAAGIWPSDGIYLYAIDAESGKEIWRNDKSGEIYMPQPHGGANATSGVSAQGYLVASGDHLFVPTGRAVPAAFDRMTGKFKYFHLQKYGHNGGAQTMAIGKMFFNSGLSFDANSGQRLSTLSGGPVAATRDGLALASNGALSIYRWKEVVKPDRKGKPVKVQALQAVGKVEDVAGGASLIVIGDTIFSGGDGRVDVVDAKRLRVSHSVKVEGVAYGLAFSDGHLVVSTDQGVISCFSENGASSAGDLEAPALPFSDNQIYRRAAEEIVRRTQASSGYCLDLGCGDGNLAYELARQTKLRIYAVEDDPEKVALARRNLIAAGVYGSRVTVHLRDFKNTGYPKYFANLIVSGGSVENGSGYPVSPSAEIERLQRPYGGATCLGEPDAMKVTVRGALEGAGSWTHQYANAANTLNSEDALVQGRLGMLWFRDVDIDIPQRHGRAPAPLFHRGRLLHQGIDGVVAIDAYNGHEIWRYEVKDLLAAYDGDELMGTAGTGSNFCVDGDSIYVRDGGRCLRLNATTGTLEREFRPPPQPNGEPQVWGYVACVNGVLYGSVANQEHVVTYRYRSTTGDMSKLLTESSSLFAMDPETGELLWQYRAKDSIRHNAIAIGQDRVFVIDRPLALFDREKRPKEKKHSPGRLLSLDAKTGKVHWSTDKNVFGTLLALSEKHDALLMSYQPTRFRLDSELGGRMAAFHSKDGDPLWDKAASYQSRPMVNGRTVFAQGGSWDLLTGEPRPFNFKRSYGCGILASGQHMMLFRSATLGYFDLDSQEQTDNYGGVRPGCWVNAIPAGGVVLVPDASAGCRCSYLNKAWFALEGEGSGTGGN